MKNPDKYFMDIAKRTAEQSRCLSRYTGAVIVRDFDIVSVGFNGPPAGFPNPGTKEYLDIMKEKYKEKFDMRDFLSMCPRRALGFKSGENLNGCPCSHCERNAIGNAAKKGKTTEGASLYIYAEGISSCFECSTAVVAAGIKEVIIDTLDVYETTGFRGLEIYTNCGVVVRKPNYDN
jgi:deoxycytidylate deaminase